MLELCLLFGPSNRKQLSNFTTAKSIMFGFVSGQPVFGEINVAPALILDRWDSHTQTWFLRQLWFVWATNRSKVSWKTSFNNVLHEHTEKHWLSDVCDALFSFTFFLQQGFFGLLVSMQVTKTNVLSTAMKIMHLNVHTEKSRARTWLNHENNPLY